MQFTRNQTYFPEHLFFNANAVTSMIYDKFLISRAFIFPNTIAEKFRKIHSKAPVADPSSMPATWLKRTPIKIILMKFAKIFETAFFIEHL